MQDTNQPEFSPAASPAHDGNTRPPVSPFPSLLDMVIEPFIAVLIYNDKNIDKVNNLDIIAASSMKGDTYLYYYGTPYAIMAEVRKEISQVTKTVKSSTNASSTAEYVITLLLRRLSERPNLIVALCLMSDLNFWLGNLSWLIERYATFPETVTPEEKEASYRYFCFQFSQIIEKWAASDFSPPMLSDYVGQILAMLDSLTNIRNPDPLLSK